MTIRDGELIIAEEGKPTRTVPCKIEFDGYCFEVVQVLEPLTPTTGSTITVSLKDA